MSERANQGPYIYAEHDAVGCRVYDLAGLAQTLEVDLVDLCAMIYVIADQYKREFGQMVALIESIAQLDTAMETGVGKRRNWRTMIPDSAPVAALVEALNGVRTKPLFGEGRA